MVVFLASFLFWLKMFRPRHHLMTRIAANEFLICLKVFFNLASVVNFMLPIHESSELVYFHLLVERSGKKERDLGCGVALHISFLKQLLKLAAKKPNSSQLRAGLPC